jgi:hypothetical protein
MTEQFTFKTIRNRRPYYGARIKRNGFGRRITFTEVDCGKDLNIFRPSMATPETIHIAA